VAQRGDPSRLTDPANGLAGDPSLREALGGDVGVCEGRNG
jgi:hypothetical protein